MLKKSCAALLMIAFLCGGIPYLQQNADAHQDDCEAARQRCADALEVCLVAAAAAALEPTFVGEGVALYLCFRAAQKCKKADEICNGGG